MQQITQKIQSDSDKSKKKNTGKIVVLHILKVSTVFIYLLFKTKN